MPNNNPQGHNQYTEGHRDTQRKSSGSRQQAQNDRTASGSQNSRAQHGDSPRRGSAQSQR